MRQRSLDEMITYFNQEIDKMDIDRRYKIALLGMVTAIGCTAKQTIEEREAGKWLYTDAYPHWMYCDRCHKRIVPNKEWIELYNIPTNYCPNCGADMRGGKEDGE